MSNPTVLVTVRGLRQTVDLELPGDIPVSDLIPLLLVICDPADDVTMSSLRTPASLRIAHANISLEPSATLIDAKIFDGTVLVLHIDDLALRPVERPVEKQFVPKLIQPGPTTGGIGVTWSKERL